MPNKKMKEGVIMDPTETNEQQKKDILSFIKAGKMKKRIIIIVYPPSRFPFPCKIPLSRLLNRPAYSLLTALRTLHHSLVRAIRFCNFHRVFLLRYD